MGTLLNRYHNNLVIGYIAFEINNLQFQMTNFAGGMDFRTYENRLSYLLELIEKQRLRSIGEVAKRFECSNRTIKRMLNHLRAQGHDVHYDRLQKKFVIKKTG